jgi:protease II
VQKYKILYTKYIQKTESEKYLIIASQSMLTSGFRFPDTNDPNGTFKIIQYLQGLTGGYGNGGWDFTINDGSDWD